MTITRRRLLKLSGGALALGALDLGRPAPAMAKIKAGSSVVPGTQPVEADLAEAGVSADLVGRTIGHYRIVRVLGVGGMGIVFLADDTRLGRPVALKALAARFTKDPQRRERLRREARAAAALAHPGIATVYALEEFDDLEPPGDDSL